jgi:spectrin beta
MLKKAATAPVSILHAKCERADDYTKRKNVFRLSLPDGSEFLFLAHSADEMNEWVKKMAFHASLPPNLQLMSYDESMKQSVTPSSEGKVDSKPQSPRLDSNDASSVSSRASSPDSHRRNSLNSAKSGSGSSSNVSTPQINFLQKQREIEQQVN